MSRATNYTKCFGTHLRETEKAIHFRVVQVGDRVLDENRTLWIPVSQVNSQTYGNTNGQDMIEVADWLLQKNELV